MQKGECLKMQLNLRIFFKNSLESIKRGAATCWQRKSKLGTYCLSEAYLWKMQAELARCNFLSIQRDESMGRLHIRWKGCAPGLGVYSGYLGRCRDCGGTAKEITKATARILKRACTRWAGLGKAVFSLPPTSQRLYKDASRSDVSPLVLNK